VKILVTGGAGFIGSNFIHEIIDKYQVINLDALTYAGNLNNLKDIENHKNYKFIHSNICNLYMDKKIMESCNTIVHFAAESHVDRSIKNSEKFIETNIRGTWALLEAARVKDIKKFIYISTDEVYGSGFTWLSNYFIESSPFNPSSPYAASKASADMLVQSYHKTYGLPTIIIRLSNCFGPYQHIEKLIPLTITNLLTNKKIPVYGNGNAIRNWLYVRDACAAIAYILSNAKLGEAYNIGWGNEKTNLDLIKRVLNYFEKDLSYIKYVKDRPGHDLRYPMNCSKITELGWKPKYDFDESLKETIEWYKNNKEWWSTLKE